MKITGVATVFPVADVAESVRFYVEKLGFREEFRFGKYAGVERELCLIHLSQAGNPNTANPGSGCIYIFCDDADACHDDLIARGSKPNEPPRSYPYGMRDFVMQDPDGNRLTFGSPVSEK